MFQYLNKKKLVMLSMLVFVSMIISLYFDSILFTLLYINNSDYRSSLDRQFASPMHFFLHSIFSSQLSFDYAITFGTYWYQFFISLFGSLSAGIFFHKNRTINQLVFYRINSYRKYQFYECLRTSILISGAVFTGFVLFWFFCTVMFSKYMVAEVTRPLFSDLLGQNFYSSHKFLYTFLEGGIKFLFVPFVYSVFGCSIALRGSLKQAIFSPVLYYFAMSIVGTALLNYNQFFSLHVGPTFLMSLGDFYYVNTIIILLVQSIPFIVGIFTIRRYTTYVEI